MSGPQPPQRTIRSFVRREGRITRAQQHALQRLLPRYGLDAGEPLDWQTAFGRRASRTLEIGFGDGISLAIMAEQEPESDFLGIEVHRPGVGRLLLELEHRGLHNVRVINDDAVTVLERCIPEHSLDRVLLFFPDPWPKKRHHKRRIVQPDFIALVARKLVAGGTLYLATDWEDYAEYMLEVMTAAADFRNCAGSDRYSPRPACRPLTKFEQRGRHLGHDVWDLVFERF
ncbi:MAG: tRNA (guanosine(46)-N7)-methyltransferase TrmB [Gammaproteobacteria bacterium]|jgi:tRNA (guanine-N7-)-methyltransferase